MSPTPAPRAKTKQIRSTGPRTPAGKAASSRNALRHGLASATLLIPGESQQEWDILCAGLSEEWMPATLTERLLVQDLAKHHWLKERALRLQSETLALAQPGELPPTFAVLLRYQTTNERAFTRALHTLQSLQKERRQFVSQKEQEAAEARQAVAIARFTAPFPPFDPNAALERYRAEAAASRSPAAHSASDPEPLAAPSAR